MINSSADDKRGIVKLGFTPRENDEYTLTYINQTEKRTTRHTQAPAARSRATGSTQYDKESYYYQGTTHLGDRFTLKSRLYRDTFENTLMMYNSLADLKTRKAAIATILITAMAQGYNSPPKCVKTICSRSPLTGKMTSTVKKARRMRHTIAMKIALVVSQRIPVGRRR